MMCSVTERGEHYLRDWGRWAARDNTINRLGYRGCSAEQMAGRVSGASDVDHNAVAEFVDRILNNVLEQRIRLIAVYRYKDNLPIKKIIMRVAETAHDLDGKRITSISKSTVETDLNTLRAMVYGAVALSF